MTKRWVTGWLLPEEERARLLERFAARYRDVIAHHVTLRTGTDALTPLPCEEQAEIVGEVDDDAGVQALIVRIAETTTRSDGGTYHITWR